MCLFAHLFKTKPFFHVHLLANSEYSTVRTWGGDVQRGRNDYVMDALMSLGFKTTIMLIDAKKLTKAISDCNNSLQN